MDRLEYVARLYYEQNKTQAQIAHLMGVSRPLVSRMLDEARQAGIVEIRICPQGKQDFSPLLQRAKDAFGISGGLIIAEGGEDVSTNHTLGQAAISMIETLGGGHLGLGWGHIIGTMVSILEAGPVGKTAITDVCPMVGNSVVNIRNYHSNENTRIVAQQTLSEAHYLHTPAVADTRQELELLLQTEQYRSVLEEWSKLNIALVNIGNHPSTPDFASGARFGDMLARRHAVGRLIAYYFDIKGEVIHSDDDFVIQIPLKTLGTCPHVVGVCSANTSAKALLGALRTGLLTHVIVREGLLLEVLQIHEK